MTANTSASPKAVVLASPGGGGGTQHFGIRGRQSKKFARP